MMAKANSRLPKKRAETKLIKSRTTTVVTPGIQGCRLGNQYLKYMPKAVISAMAKISQLSQ